MTVQHEKENNWENFIKTLPNEEEPEEEEQEPEHLQTINYQPIPIRLKHRRTLSQPELVGISQTLETEETQRTNEDSTYRSYQPGKKLKISRKGSLDKSSLMRNVYFVKLF